MSDFCKKPCANCPYRQDVKPFLHPQRGAELAYICQSKYSTFHCHKTLEHDDDNGDTYAGKNSKVCAGFLSLQHNERDETRYDDQGFKPSSNVYESSLAMALAYRNQGK